MDTNSEDFANTIIIQAVEDVRIMLGILSMYPGYTEPGVNEHEIERFFRSKWFSLLTKADPEMIIRRIRSEVV